MSGLITMSNLSILFAYLLGAIPFGVIVGRFSGVDVRKTGSGNIGATNIQRVLGWKHGILVLALDAMKGTAAVVLVQALAPGLSEWYVPMGALAAVLGHSFSVFIGFRGGRSVAVTLGAFLLLAPWPILIALGVFILTVAVTRYVSLGSILAAVAFAVAEAVRCLTMSLDDISLLTACSLAALLILARHRANLARLMSGQENRLSFHRKG